jgi:hypothetical protein
LGHDSWLQRKGLAVAFTGWVFFSAAAVFLIASVLLAVPAVEKANTASEKHQKLLCAHDYFGPGR